MTSIAEGEPAGFGARLSGLLAAHGAKGLRFAGVSAFNVVLGQVLLFGAYSLAGWDAVPSQIFAAVVGSIPAYLLCRSWVWKVDGVISVTREVLPFWGLALLGLLASSVAVKVAAAWAEDRWGVGPEAQLAVTTASLAAYGVVWVAKYFILDRVLFADDG